MQETLFRGRSKAKSPCGSSIAYRSKAITPPRSGGSYPQVAEVEIAEAIEVVDPSYPDEEPGQVAVVVSYRASPGKNPYLGTLVAGPTAGRTAGVTTLRI